MHRFFIHLSIVLLLCACHSKTEMDGIGYNGTGAYEAEEEIMPITRQEALKPPPPPLVEMDAPASNVTKKIIKDGRMALKVQALTASKQYVDSLVQRFDAYYSREDLHKSRFEDTYSLTIRIPFTHFETFIARLESRIGEVQYKNLEARDVTAEFIDLETRLSNKRSYLIRYKELLKKAQTVKDILTIENEIRKIEEEIDSSEGRLKYLSDQVKYSTLQLDLNQEKEYVYIPKKADRFMERVKESFSGGWQGFISFTLLLVRLWPFLIVLALLVFWWKRRRTRRKALKATEKKD